MATAAYEQRRAHAEEVKPLALYDLQFDPLRVVAQRYGLAPVQLRRWLKAQETKQCQPR
jgi:hypothetical protein